MYSIRAKANELEWRPIESAPQDMSRLGSSMFHTTRETAESAARRALGGE